VTVPVPVPAGTNKLTRHMMAKGDAKDVKVNEFHLDKVLEGLDLTMEQFVDMCILCGCDYLGTIEGIGPVRALKHIKEHGSIEEVLKHLDPSKHAVPADFPFEDARRLFHEPEVRKEGLAELLKWTAPDEEGLVQFMVHEKNFQLVRCVAAGRPGRPGAPRCSSPRRTGWPAGGGTGGPDPGDGGGRSRRIENAIKKIKDSKGKASQGRLESFFGAAVVKTAPGKLKKKDEPKRKGGKLAGGVAKKGKLGGVGGKKK